MTHTKISIIGALVIVFCGALLYLFHNYVFLGGTEQSAAVVKSQLVLLDTNNFNLIKTWPSCDPSAKFDTEVKEYVYKSVVDESGRTHVLRVIAYLPDPSRSSNKKYPAVAMFHGGGHHTGDPISYFSRIGPQLASQGVAAFAFQYRLVNLGVFPPSDVQTITRADASRDAISALRWMNRYADELTIDTDKIATLGTSAGGHLAILGGMVSDFDLPIQGDENSVEPFVVQSVTAFYPMAQISPYKEFSPLDIMEQANVVSGSVSIPYNFHKASDDKLNSEIDELCDLLSAHDGEDREAGCFVSKLPGSEHNYTNTAEFYHDALALIEDDLNRSLGTSISFVRNEADNINSPVCQNVSEEQSSLWQAREAAKLLRYQCEAQGNAQYSESKFCTSENTTNRIENFGPHTYTPSDLPEVVDTGAKRFIWYNDNNLGTGGELPKDFEQVFENPVLWKKAAKYIDAYFLKSTSVRLNPDVFTDNFLENKMWPVLEEYDIKLGVELIGATWAQCRWGASGNEFIDMRLGTTGQTKNVGSTYKNEIDFLQRLERLGLDVSYINFVSTMSKKRVGDANCATEYVDFSSESLERRADDIVEAMDRIITAVPAARNYTFTTLDSLPFQSPDNWKEGYELLKTKLGNASGRLKGKKIEHITLDVPYELVQNKIYDFSYNKMLEVESFLENDIGVDFAYINVSQVSKEVAANSPVAAYVGNNALETGETLSSQTYRNTMRFASSYLKSKQGTPSRMLYHAYFPDPEYILPDNNQPDTGGQRPYSAMYTINALGQFHSDKFPNARDSALSKSNRVSLAKKVRQDEIDSDVPPIDPVPDDTIDREEEVDTNENSTNNISGGGGGGESLDWVTPESEVKKILDTMALNSVNSADTVCQPYLTDNIGYGRENSSETVRRLELFLNESEGESLTVDGVFSQSDLAAVNRYQNKHAKSVLHIWNLDTATGFVGITTRMKINSLLCNKTLSCPIFSQYNSLTENNNSAEVKRTKVFMKELGFYNGTINTVFDSSMHASMITFQETFAETMLHPWDIYSGTGYKYKTTNKFMNELVGCATDSVLLDNGVNVNYDF